MSSPWERPSGSDLRGCFLNLTPSAGQRIAKIHAREAVEPVAALRENCNTAISNSDMRDDHYELTDKRIYRLTSRRKRRIAAPYRADLRTNDRWTIFPLENSKASAEC